MGIISTIEARCKDCYKCLRACPVKAIKFVPGDASGELHARVVDDMCVLCGTCVKECPQNAKKVREDLDVVKHMLESKRPGVPIGVSIAPSFVSGMMLEEPLGIVSALKRLGFDVVEETAIGAALVAKFHSEYEPDSQPKVIGTACPVVVNLVEKYYPDAISSMTPVVSPMIAHARDLRARHPGIQVVFIGPCFAKKSEAEEAYGSSEVAAVLTFAELAKWFEEEGIDLEQMQPAEFEGPNPGTARFFPLEGGLPHTASMETGVGAKTTLAVSGIEECMDFLKMAQEDNPLIKDIAVADLLACRGGCINGPGIATTADQFTRRAHLVQYAAAKKRLTCEVDEPSAEDIDLSRAFCSKQPKLRQPTEQEIRQILERTGKMTEADELNCGSCGYSSCRAKAIAVYQGLAEIEMCLPYMRSKAESLSNSVVEHAPDGIVVVDSACRIVQVNRSFERMFGSGAKNVLGQPLANIIDSENYERVLSEHRPIMVTCAYPKYGVVTLQTIFYMPDQRLAVGIMADITEEEKRKEAMLKLKAATMTRAQEVINKQMKVAQEIASLLGETTAETKVLLSKIIELNRQD